MTDAKSITKPTALHSFQKPRPVVAVGLLQVKGKCLSRLDCVAERLKLMDGATERTSPNFMPLKAEIPDIPGSEALT